MHKIITYCIAIVWLINGLYCKVLGFVPRHQEIVARILGEKHSLVLTQSIGVLELFMVVWIVSKYKSKLNAITQIVVIMLMNCIEFFLAKDLLLFGSFNLIFAVLFVSLICLNEFVLKPKNA
jgi:hypothetical protein